MKERPSEKETPPFEIFAPIPRAEEWEIIKRELFTGKEPESMEAQPHGIDLRAENFAEINQKSEGIERIIALEKPQTAKTPLIIHLEPGREYFALLSPPLRISPDKTNFFLRLFPKSSLLRAGIAAEESSFRGSGSKKEQLEIGSFFDKYRDGLQGAFRIRITNPNGVEVEIGAPFVQIIPERMPNDPALRQVAEAQELFLKEHGGKKKMPLHLGAALRFLPKCPRLAKERADHRLDVTEEIRPEENHWRLKKGQPYILRTEETVVLSAHELGFAKGSVSGADAYGDALVDAGYKGALIFLTVPKKDITVRVGEKIADFLKINVPTTKKPYQREWK